MTQQKRIFTDPSEVDAKDGTVEVEGPDEVDIALTPEAAEETSDRLLDKSMKARGQRRMEDMAHKPKE